MPRSYRRCAGERLIVEFINEFPRKVWREKISFEKLDIQRLGLERFGQVPINPRTALNDDIAFKMAK